MEKFNLAVGQRYVNKAGHEVIIMSVNKDDLFEDSFKLCHKTSMYQCDDVDCRKVDDYCYWPLIFLLKENNGLEHLKKPMVNNLTAKELVNQIIFKKSTGDLDQMEYLVYILSEMLKMTLNELDKIEIQVGEIEKRVIDFKSF